MKIKLVKAAETEWLHWRSCTWNLITGKTSNGYLIDDDAAGAQHVIDTYLPPFYAKTAKWPDILAIGNDDYYWSAVAISHFMLAGFSRKKLLSAKATAAEYTNWVAKSTKDEFPISESHSDYIRWSIRARRDGIKDASYWGYRVDETEAIPEVGDLIGYARGVKGLTHAKALKFFDKTGGYSSHTDLVVAKRPGEIDVIGGNVRDSVCLKTVALSAKGQIADKNFRWFVVMKLRA